MMKVARYNPRENGGNVQVFRQVSKPTTWRIDAVVEQENKAPERFVMRVVDKLLLSDVYEAFSKMVEEAVPEGAQVTDAYCDFWAQV